MSRVANFAFGPTADHKSRRVVEEIVARDGVVYGVSTGFGKLAEVQIPHDELRQLQLNLVRSHACGIGVAAFRSRKCAR